VTLTQLRYLVAIADCDLNVTAAAGRVHATQSGVSKQIKKLEEELGYPVFVRIGKSLDHVTEPGAAVIQLARTILARVADIRSLSLDFDIAEINRTIHVRSRTRLTTATVEAAHG
jgi:LysR family cys regulon transcriptional activator